MSTITLKEYFARQSSGFSNDDAKVIGPELEKLADEGKNSSREIVEYSTSEDSPLHKYFEWNNEDAANLYREWQARHMAASIMIKVKTAEGNEKEVRAFHAIKVEIVSDKQEQRQKNYIHIDTIQENPEMIQQVMDEAKKYLIGWKARYSAYREIFKDEELNAMFDLVDKIEQEKIKKAS